MLAWYLQRLAAFGCLGFIIEVIFTGSKSVLRGHYDAPARTYLPCFFVYGTGGMLLEKLDSTISWNIFLKAIPFTGAIFAVEFIFGLVLIQWLGLRLWKYTIEETGEEIHRFSILGLVRVDYAVYWYGLSVLFIYFSPRIKVFMNVLSRL